MQPVSNLNFLLIDLHIQSVKLDRYRNSVFDIATSYGLDGAGFESRQMNRQTHRPRQEDFACPKPFRRALKAHPVSSKGYQNYFPGVKRQGA